MSCLPLPFIQTEGLACTQSFDWAQRCGMSDKRIYRAMYGKQIGDFYLKKVTMAQALIYCEIQPETSFSFFSTLTLSTVMYYLNYS